MIFCHETLTLSPALSKKGEIRSSGDKAELLKCLRKTSASSESQTVPPIKDAACTDGLFIKNLTISTKNQIFKKCCKESFTYS